MRRLNLIGWVIILAAQIFVAQANQPDIPPLTRETAVGDWEALPNAGVQPKLLLRMQIGKEDAVSYLAEVLLDSPPVCRLFRLEHAEFEGGEISLHFVLVQPAGRNGEIWIQGTGFADSSIGVIEGTWRSTEVTPAEKIDFMRGSWTRSISEGSREAERRIKAVIAPKTEDVTE